jgi:hypothetical protein
MGRINLHMRNQNVWNMSLFIVPFFNSLSLFGSLDRDPHQGEKSDLDLHPDPYQIKNQNPDPHQGEKLNPYPHQRDADPQHWLQVFICPGQQRWDVCK